MTKKSLRVLVEIDEYREKGEIGEGKINFMDGRVAYCD